MLSGIITAFRSQLCFNYRFEICTGYFTYLYHMYHRIMKITVNWSVKIMLDAKEAENTTVEVVT